jgi:hypothetical protein
MTDTLMCIDKYNNTLTRTLKKHIHLLDKKMINNLSCNHNLDIKFVYENMDKYEWDWTELPKHVDLYNLCKNKNILNVHFIYSLPYNSYINNSNMKIILDEFSILDENFFINSSNLIVKEYLNSYCDETIIWDFVQDNIKKTITWNFVQDNIKNTLIFDNLSIHKCITIDIINKFPDLWNYDMLSCNPNLSFDDFKTIKFYIKNHEYYFRDGYITKDYVNYSDKFKFEDVINNKYICFDSEKYKLYWNFNDISKHYSITWNIIKNYPNEDWNYIFVAQNPNITWDIIEDNSCLFYKNKEEKKKVYISFAKNPNITSKMIDNIIEENKDDNKFIENFLKNLILNDFCYHKYYSTLEYKKKLVNIFIEEMIKEACNPRRILNWNENVLNDNIFKNLSQNDINDLYNSFKFNLNKSNE